MYWYKLIPCFFWKIYLQSSLLFDSEFFEFNFDPADAPNFRKGQFLEIF